MRWIFCLLTSLMILAIQVPIRAAETSMSMTKQEADKIVDTTKWKTVKSKKDLPANLLKPLGLEDISDINGPFSSGCTGNEPHRRLAAAAYTDEYVAVLTESGGIAYFLNLSLYRRSKDGVTSIYTGMVPPKEIAEVEKKLGK